MRGRDGRRGCWEALGGRAEWPGGEGQLGAGGEARAGGGGWEEARRVVGGVGRGVLGNGAWEGRCQWPVLPVACRHVPARGRRETKLPFARLSMWAQQPRRTLPAGQLAEVVRGQAAARGGLRLDGCRGGRCRPRLCHKAPLDLRRLVDGRRGGARGARRGGGRGSRRGALPMPGPHTAYVGAAGPSPSPSCILQWVVLPGARFPSGGRSALPRKRPRRRRVQGLLRLLRGRHVSGGGARPGRGRRGPCTRQRGPVGDAAVVGAVRVRRDVAVRAGRGRGRRGRGRGAQVVTVA